ncbi:hypothetical protein C8035_v002746 [Colletotrichum spinosum]|uniref:Uncharacterized protein n=1 Tax=Colletotrichum spinosum TaxID=1347390 RepID=A0A4R8Q9S9_9PEZI|nr:hypothetical protein C8035_v002746 [Colletotrichum spinosum]
MSGEHTISTLLWPPHLFSHLLSHLSHHSLDRFFYHADICLAYHVLTLMAVWLTTVVNSLVFLCHLDQSLRTFRDRSVEYRRIGSINRFLLGRYLGGHFLVPNLVGPIWICWYLSPRDGYLDTLAHLYGFLIGLLHLPLLLCVSLHLTVPLIFSVLCQVPILLSKAVWHMSGLVPAQPVVATQNFLRWLHGWLLDIPAKVVRLVDRDALRAEHGFFVTAMRLVVAMQVFILYTMVVECFRPNVQRFAIQVAADALVAFGDAMIGAGMWVESLVVKGGFWEEGHSWHDIFLDVPASTRAFAF